MFPIRDTIPSRNTPVVVWLLVPTNSMVFVFELMMPEPVLEQFFYHFGIVHARYSRPAWAVWMKLSPLGEHTGEERERSCNHTPS